MKSGTDFKHLSHVMLTLEGGHVVDSRVDRYDVTRQCPPNAEMTALAQKYNDIVADRYCGSRGRASTHSLLPPLLAALLLCSPLTANC